MLLEEKGTFMSGKINSVFLLGLGKVGSLVAINSRQFKLISPIFSEP